MATPRMPFLYPNLLRAVRACAPTTYRSIRTPPPRTIPLTASLHTSRRCAQETFQQRYGPAASPDLPPPPKPSEPLTPTQGTDPKKDASKSPNDEPLSPPESRDPLETAQQSPGHDQIAMDTPSTAPGPVLDPLPNQDVDMILSVPSPSEIKAEGTHKHPHLEASLYEHHFDTYSLVQQLATSGFELDQSVTIMKAIRLKLAENLDLAKESLVSKSDVENETYLFRAACDELRNTLHTTRQSETQKQRSQRAQLQHEVDILAQKLTQDLLSMREDLKGMFNDRKLGVQEEKRRIDGKISELNYEITVLLNSDSKSEVEGLRWVLTRRAAMAIVIAASMTLLALNLSSRKIREREEIEKKKEALKKAEHKRMQLAAAAAVGESARYTTPSRSHGSQTDSSAGGADASYEESLG